MRTSSLPEHIAIIMDGNGRWAKKRHLPRVAGHKVGVETVREVVKSCVEKGIKVVSLFAFSSENWRRPQQEVSYLMELFLSALEREVKKLHKQNIQLRIIGDKTPFNSKLQEQIAQAEQLTQDNTGLKLIVAVNYGGQWDITEAARQLAVDVLEGKLSSQAITAEAFQTKLATKELPNPDLFIRTGGEQRISNFLIWQLAYAELYFTDIYWPDFTTAELDKALAFYASRERRFGYTSEQLAHA